VSRLTSVPVSLPVLRTTSAAAALIAALLWAASGCATSGEGAGVDATNGAGAAEAELRPNVLLICVDDLRPELSCLGSTWVRTPHMDRLAAGGVAFRNHFVAVPTCGASRYALLTGRSPARSGVTAGNTALYEGGAALPRGESEGARSLPELFRRAGWRTVGIGKISHTPDGRVFAYDGSGDGRPELPDAWDELPTPFGPWLRGWGAFFGYAGGRHREDGSGYRPLSEFTAETDDELPDGLIAARAVERLGELAARGAQDDQPFFLAVGFSKPHLPFVATAGDRADVEAWGIGSAEHPLPTSSRYTHASGEFFKYQRDFEQAPVIEDAAQIEARSAYAACVRFVDRQVGRVLDAVDDLGLADDTIVVLWSDHGWHLGESGLWGKHTPHERALRSPLIVRAPGVTRGGVVSDALVESTDVYPTLVELAGLGVPVQLDVGEPSLVDAEGPPIATPLDGDSLVPVLTGERDALRDHALSFWGQTVSLRTTTHRLIARPLTDGSFVDVELYDLASGEDPLRDMSGGDPRLALDLLRVAGLRLMEP
jgi:arylsulfatase A-like enzyme